MYFKSINRGFTLVELSIVLVIIGLLIGGILVAQSMIKTTKVTSFVREIRQYDVAISNFREKYKGIPGDSSTMGCTNYGGNTCNDGALVSSTGNSGGQSTPDTDGEIGAFWRDLQRGGFTYKNVAFSPYTNTSVAWDFKSNAPNSPMIKASIDSGIAVMTCGWTGYAETNCYTLFTFDPNAPNDSPSTYVSPPLLTPEMALAIDLKMDDSAPYGGDVRNYMQAIDQGPSNDSACDDSNKYLVANNDAPHCYMQIHIMKDEDGVAAVAP